MEQKNKKAYLITDYLIEGIKNIKINETVDSDEDFIDEVDFDSDPKKEIFQLNNDVDNNRLALLNLLKIEYELKNKKLENKYTEIREKYLISLNVYLKGFCDLDHIELPTHGV